MGPREENLAVSFFAVANICPRLIIVVTIMQGLRRHPRACPEDLLAARFRGPFVHKVKLLCWQNR